MYCTIEREHKGWRQKGYRIQTLISKFYRRYEYTEPFKVSHLPWAMRITLIHFQEYVWLSFTYVTASKSTLQTSSAKKLNWKGNNCVILSGRWGQSFDIHWPKQWIKACCQVWLLKHLVILSKDRKKIVRILNLH